MYQTGEQLTFWAQLKPTDIAFADQDHEITFKELDIFTSKIAFTLRARGIERGDFVGLALPPYLSWIFMLSLFRLGAVPVWTSHPKLFIQDVMPLWLVSTKSHLEVDQSHTIIFDDNYLSEINASQRLSVEMGFRSPDELASLFPTSGSTGDPKYIAISAGELRDIAIRPSTYDSFGEDPVLSLMGFGSTWATWAALKCLVLGKPYLNCITSDEYLPKFPAKHSVKTLIGSPVQIAKFLDVQEKTQSNFSSIRSVLVGGSEPSQLLVERIRKNLSARIYNTYGSTEAGHIAIFEIKEGNSGALVRPPVQLEIVDENDLKLPPHSIGRIRYRNPGMATGYYKNAIASQEFFRDGFFYPGDQGYLDDEGKLFLSGRSAEVINLGGVKVNPEVIDQIAISQLGIVDCGTFSTLDKTGVEVAVIAIVINEDFDEEHFSKAIGSKSPYQVVAATKVVSIPRNEAGKILRHVLRENYELKKRLEK